MIERPVRRILLVEDDPLIRRAMSICLMAGGYEVRMAIDGFDALTKLRVELPDLIITDLNMPRMSGFELLEVVRKRFPQLPCVAMGARALDETPGVVAADAYYYKNGIEFDELLGTIVSLAGKLPLRAARPLVDNEPVQAKRDDNGNFIVSCGNCLRKFTVLRAFHISQYQNWVTCEHCGNFVLVLAGEPAESKKWEAPRRSQSATFPPKP